LIICDEGHRLKTPGNKAAKAIQSFATTRRILLTGTPIQNDLGEFFTMVDFVNPGLLDSYAVFKRGFEGPIVKGRQPAAKKKDVELGRARSGALSLLTGMFVLRRTSEILSQYLPVKCTPHQHYPFVVGADVDEYVVFCTPTELQQRMYNGLLESQGIKQCLYEGDTSAHLKAISLLRKISNAASLVFSKAENVSLSLLLFPVYPFLI
jgi:DNA repair and recombination protein RAD54B